MLNFKHAQRFKGKLSKVNANTELKLRKIKLTHEDNYSGYKSYVCKFTNEGNHTIHSILAKYTQ